MNILLLKEALFLILQDAIQRIACQPVPEFLLSYAYHESFFKTFLRNKSSRICRQGRDTESELNQCDNRVCLKSVQHRKKNDGPH